MKLKEFLKPTIGKIAVFIILLLFFMYFSPCSYAGGVPPGPYVSGWTFCEFRIVFFAIGGQMTDGGYSFFGIANLAQYAALILILLISISYLLSCVILDLFKRFKK